MKTRTTIAGHSVQVHTEQDPLTGTWRYKVETPASAGADEGFSNQAEAVYAALNRIGGKKGIWVGAAGAAGAAVIVLGMIAVWMGGG